MAFEHLANTYANYYLAGKRVAANRIPLKEDLIEFEVAKEEYQRQLKAFEDYLDIVGDNYLNDLIGSIVRCKSDENRMGTIQKKKPEGWLIEWYSVTNLEPLGTSIESDLSQLDILESN